MGLWRTRIDGFLYSKGEYVIFFDAGDMYEDNYVLEDASNIMKKYDIDAVKMICRFIYDFKNLTNILSILNIKKIFISIFQRWEW